jgi:16S rRNA G966 N2-methylase RsmD
VRFIKETSAKLKFEGHKILHMDVFQFIENTNESFDVIFAGPPYKMPFLDTLPDLVIQKGLIEGEGWFILEHDPKYNFDNHPNLWRRKNYGQTNFSIFTNEIHND